MEFLKLSEVELNSAGYLVSKVSKKPVTHAAFIQQQKTAEYTVKLAEAIKGKNFKNVQGADLAAIKAEVLASIFNTEQKYVATPESPKSKVQDELVKYALDFNKYNDTLAKNLKINNIMNQFNKINDVESVGEYFTEGVEKLNALYNIETILEAVKITVETLD